MSLPQPQTHVCGEENGKKKKKAIVRREGQAGAKV
jgi:hypothetical protein